MAVRKRNVLVLSTAVLLAGGAAAIAGGGGTVAHAFDPTQAPEIQDRLLDATADIELGYNSPVSQDGPSVGNYQAASNKQCDVTLGGNVKVNQGCVNVSAPAFQGRSQAQNETSIAANPADPNQLVATSNDYRRGDGTCGVSWSNNGGRLWQDSTLPNGFVSGAAYGGVAREYFQGSGDPAVAWDSKGNVYYSCQEFQRGAPTTNNPDTSSSIYLYRSTGNGGASWSFPGSAVRESACLTKGCSAPFIDKPLMTVDNHSGSPFQDRIYVTWTEFASDGSAFIYGAHSSNYGRTFSKPVLVSGNTSLCPNTYGLGTTATTGQHSNCNENQFSDPFTGADGNLYVTFNNFNNSLSGAGDNHNQILLARSTDGGATFSAPVLVSNYYDLPDCATYQNGQDFGRACVPEQGSQKDSVFRATNYSSGAVNPTNSSQIVVTLGSYVNQTDASTCAPNGFAPSGNNRFNGVKTSACGNKILVSVSNTSGTTFANTDPKTEPTANGPDQSGSDQWWQWSGFTGDGKIVTSYYDRSYGSDETTGNMDITVSASQNGSNQLSFRQKLVTSSSMPLPTEFPNGLGNSQFFGDYTGLAVSNQANPLWMDTRDVDLFDCGTNPPALCTGIEPNGRQANDEDLFTDQVGV